MGTDETGNDPGPRKGQREERGLCGGKKAAAEHGNIDDSTTEATEGRLKTKRFHLLFDLGRSRRYCAKLAAHYSRLEKVTTLISLAAGSAIIVDVFANWPNIQLYGGLVILVMTLANLVFGWPDLARDWRLRHARYTALDVRLNRLGLKASGDNLDELRSDYIEIETNEPAPKLVLNMICHNEQCGVMDAKADQRPIRFHQRWAAYFMNLPPANWE